MATDNFPTVDPATRAFIDRLGIRFETDGLPRIAGQVLGLLLVSRADRSLDETADVLAVSKASVSSNARLLLRMGLVVRTALPGDRRDYYRIAEDAEAGLIAYQMRRLRESRDVLQEGLDTPAAADPVIRTRLMVAAETLTRALEQLPDAAGHYAEPKATETGDDMRHAG